MKITPEPQAGSYEAALNDEQRGQLHRLLLSGVTLAGAALIFRWDLGWGVAILC